MPATDEDRALLRPLEFFRGARDAASPGDRLKDVRAAARRFRDEFSAGSPVPYYRSFDLIRVPYPTRYALRDACSVPLPLIHLLNRMFVVQFRGAGGLKTLLVGPSDYKANEQTPYFRRLRERLGPFRGALTPVLAPEAGPVEHWLEVIGLKPESVDLITYDHLHTQDLRRWFGSGERTGFFPNARLLVMRQEWESLRHLAPPQLDWYCPRGVEGLHPSRVILLDGDVALGEGVALVRTSGHTEGNHSIVVHTPEGLLVTSENGVSADCYAPEHSGIPGVRRYARDTGMEVVLNGNTLERGLDQYLSMIQEREMAGPSPRDRRFYNVVPSSELSPYWLFPGISPTFRFGELAFGELRT